MKYLIFYIAVISVISIILTGYDKFASKARPRSRVPEAVFILFSALGGSMTMYITMHLIRHKTKHIKFMLGIPLIMICQFLTVGIVYYSYF